MNPQQRAEVQRRAHNCCEYCGSQEDYSPDTYSVEHIIPRSKDGDEEIDNLAYACQGCNNRKYISIDAVDPLSGSIAPLYNPRRDRWSDHFIWSEDFAILLGISPTGRATIAKLELNRKGVVNLRRVLYALGVHPAVTPS